MERGWPTGGGLLHCLAVSLLLQGKANTFTINCSGFDQHGVDPVAFQTVFKQKDFRPVINYSIPTQVNTSFTLSAILEVTWNNPFISWDPEECGHINKLTVTTENLWLPDIFIVESMDVDQTLEGRSAYVTNDGHIVYSKPMQVTSICSLDIFYFPFDQQNCTLTFGSVLYAGGHQAQAQTLCHKPFGPSSFLVAIDALSFYLPAESENRAPFKMTLLLGYNVFLLMMNKLLPASGTPLISMYPLPQVDFALCLSLMVLSLLETIFITYLLHLAPTQPPPMPRWLHSLLLHCTSATKRCLTALWKENVGPELTPTHMPGLKEPRELVGKKLEPREAELNGSSGLTRAQLTDLWVQFSQTMDTFLFSLYLLFLASSIITVIILWNT